MVSVWQSDLGTRQGRLAPGDFAAPAGDYVHCLGSTDPSPIVQVAVGDYVELAQDASLLELAYLRLTARLVPPRIAPPAGCYWWFSMRVDGAEVIGHPIPNDRSRILTDIGANVSALTGTHEVAFRLELRGAGGPYSVALPAVYLDALTAEDASLFLPTGLTDLLLWLRADLGVSLVGPDVDQWADQSGNGNDLASGGAGTRPLYLATGGPNSQPCIEFDGVAEYLSNAILSCGQPCHMWVVSIPTRGDNNNDVICDGTTLNTRLLYPANSPNVGIYAGAGPVQVGTVRTDWHRIESQFDGASSSISIDGAAPTSGNAGAGAASGMILGRRGGGSAIYGDTTIAEVILCSSLQSAGNAALMNAALAARYSL